MDDYPDLEGTTLGPIDLDLTPSRGGDEDSDRNTTTSTGGSITVHVPRGSGDSNSGLSESFTSGSRVSTQPGSVSSPSGGVTGETVSSGEEAVSGGGEAITIEDTVPLESGDAVKPEGSPTSSRNIDEA